MRIDIKKYGLKLTHKFRIARETQTICYNLFLKMNINGLTGYGESAPTAYYNENIDTMCEAVDSIYDISEPNLENPDTFFEELEKLYPNYPSLRAGIEMAVYDIIGKLKNKSVCELFGLDSSRTPLTSFTIGIDKPELLKMKFEEAEKYPVIKIKMGSEFDYEIINFLKNIKDKKIRIDANEGWKREEAVKKMELLKEIGVEFVEQPLKKQDLEGILWLKERVDMKLFTDENVKTSQDINNIKDIYDGINIKLMKCGGLSEAKKMIDIAHSYNIEVMLGCMIESSLAITAASQISPSVEYADLDGNLLISNDPFKGVSVINGKLVIPKKPGLGLEELGLF